MFGKASVYSDMMLGLISSTYRKEKLQVQSASDRETLADLRKVDRNDDTEENLSPLDEFALDHRRVSVLSAIVQRYTNGSCHTMEKC